MGTGDTLCASGVCSFTSQLSDLAKRWPLEVFLQLQAALRATVQELPSISSTPPGISAAGLAGSVWERWERSCLADAGQCHPTTRNSSWLPRNHTPLESASSAKTASRVLGAPLFPSLFQPDSSLHIPPKTRHYQPGCCSDRRDTTARVCAGTDPPVCAKHRDTWTPGCCVCFYPTVRSSPGAPRCHSRSSETAAGLEYRCRGSLTEGSTVHLQSSPHPPNGALHLKPAPWP